MEKIIQPVVIKIGTSSLTGSAIDGGINKQVLRDMAEITREIVTAGRKMIIVSSGAMGLGIAKMGIKEVEAIAQRNAKSLNDGDDLITMKQALTSIGQIELMKEYQNIFEEFDLTVGQVLLTHRGLQDPERHLTIKKTLSKLFEMNIVPVVNENDTVTSKEIVFGDNDTLSAEVAVLMKAKTLFLLTDTKGLYDSNPNENPDAKLIKKIDEVTDEIREAAGGSDSATGTGGMSSKVQAGEICQKHDVTMQIMHYKDMKRIPEILREETELGTKFV